MWRSRLPGAHLLLGLGWEGSKDPWREGGRVSIFSLQPEQGAWGPAAPAWGSSSARRTFEMAVACGSPLPPCCNPAPARRACKRSPAPLTDAFWSCRAGLDSCTPSPRPIWRLCGPRPHTCCMEVPSPACFPSPPLCAGSDPPPGCPKPSSDIWCPGRPQPLPEALLICIQVESSPLP